MERNGRRILVVTVSTVAAVAILVTAVAVFRSTPDSRATVAESKQAYLTHLEETMGVAGGSWLFEDGKTAFSHEIAETYTPEPCLSSSSDELQYQINTVGPGRTDVGHSVDLVTADWKQRGYSVRTVAPPNPSISDNTEIAADLPDGGTLVYSVSTRRSSIDSQSLCFAGDARPAQPHEVFLDHVTDAIAVSGGKWTFGDKTTPFSVGEARKDKPQECLSDSSAEQYDLGLFGPASDDPAKTVDEMTRHWQDLGYTVESVADTSDDMEITASVPDGSTLNFFASTGVTSLITQSPCVKAEG